jgi:hypothetical protein
LDESSPRVVDATGKIVREALVVFFPRLDVPPTRVGLEAGPLSRWLHAGLTKAAFDMVGAVPSR